MIAAIGLTNRSIYRLKECVVDPLDRTLNRRVSPGLIKENKIERSFRGMSVVISIGTSTGRTDGSWKVTVPRGKEDITTVG